MKIIDVTRWVLGLCALGAVSASCTALVGGFDGPGGTGVTAGTTGTGGRTGTGAATSSSASGPGAGGAGGMTTTSAGGAGGTTSAASSSSGAPMCTGDGDCASQSTTCLPSTCVKMECEQNPAARGLACTGAGGKSCDGNGACVACLSSSDCPPTGTSCVSATCAGNACGTQNAADHSPCSDAGGKLCLAGACVVCLTTADCSSGNVCQNHLCIGQCSDGLQDGTETDRDCGGGSCPPCAAGSKCTQNNDCVSTAACSSGVCATCVSNINQACGSCNGVVECDGTCSIATPPNFGASCGSCGGVVICGGGCSVATPPNLGAQCTGLHCTCGGNATGEIGCAGKCVIDNPCQCCGSLPC